MASLFTHAFVGTVLGQAGTSDWRKNWRFWCLIIVCSSLPDIDSIGFHLGIPYSSFWGHRGFTHSLAFAAILAICLATGFSRTFRQPWMLALLLFFVTATHGLLDAMTDGGLGVAFFSPFDLHRYFYRGGPFTFRRLESGGFSANAACAFCGVRLFGSGSLFSPSGFWQKRYNCCDEFGKNQPKRCVPQASKSGSRPRREASGNHLLQRIPPPNQVN